MKYFCSFSYIHDGSPHFGNCILESQVDPYDDIYMFREGLKAYIMSNTPYRQVVLLFYKKVKP